MFTRHHALLGLCVAIATGCAGSDDPPASSLPPVTVTGRVLDGQGRPVESVALEIDTVPALTMRTGRLGTFRFDVRPGEYTVTSRIGGIIARTDPVEVLRPGPVGLGDLQVTSTVTGRTVDALGNGVSDVDVRINHSPPIAVVSDQDGKFEFEAVAGSYQPTFGFAGRTFQGAELFVDLPDPLDLGDIQVLSVVEGRLLDGLLRPLTDAVVTIDTVPETLLLSTSGGSFETRLPRGDYEFVVRRDGIELLRQEVTVADDRPLRLGNLQVLVHTIGRVVDEVGLPVSDATIRIDTVPPTESPVDEEGRFALGLPSGDFGLTVQLLGIVVAQRDASLRTGSGVADLGEIHSDPAVDADEDTLADALEVRGWPILVTENGVDPIERWVRSSPDMVDSDGDGLSDARELVLRTDPRRSDTDADGVPDPDEVDRYLSNPNHVDSDGDARLLDGDGQPIGLPNPALFDGAEIHDSATSPILDDTDGDGLTDTHELLVGGTNPLLSDQPLVDIELVGDPLVVLNIAMSSTTVQGTLQREVNSQSRTDSETTQTTSELSGSVTATATYESPASGSASVEANASWSEGTFEEQSSSFTRSSERELQQSLERSNTTEFENATMTAAFRITNRSDLSFAISNLSVLAYRIRPTKDAGALQVIGTLQPEEGLFSRNGSSTPQIISPRGSLQFAASNATLNYQPILDFIREPHGLVFAVGTYSLQQVNASGEITGDYAAIAQQVTERTGLLVIDFGGGNIERYAIATNLERNQDGSAMGITLARAMEIAGVPLTTALGTYGPDPLDPHNPARPGPFNDGRRVIDTVRGLGEVLEANRPAISWWMAFGENMTEEVGDLEFTVDIDQVRLLPGRRITLVRFTDADGDGLTARDEMLFGTSDRECDSDGDTLNDYFEVREGWEVQFQDCDAGVGRPQFNYRAFSNPRSPDEDGDGLADPDEASANLPAYVDAFDRGAFCETGVSNPDGRGTNPNLVDTDADGAPDDLDDCVDAPNSGGGGLPADGLWLAYRLDESETIGSGGSASTPDRASGPRNDGLILGTYHGIRFTPDAGAESGVYTWPNRFGQDGTSFWMQQPDIGDPVAVRVSAGVDGFEPPDDSWAWVTWVYVPSRGLADGTLLSVDDWLAMRIENGQMGLELVRENSVPLTLDWRLQTAAGGAVAPNSWLFYAVVARYDPDANNGSGSTNVKIYRGMRGQTVSVIAEQDSGMAPLFGTATGSMPTRFRNPVHNGTSRDVRLGGYSHRGSPELTRALRGALDDVRLFSEPLETSALNALLNESSRPGR